MTKNKIDKEDLSLWEKVIASVRPLKHKHPKKRTTATLAGQTTTARPYLKKEKISIHKKDDPVFMSAPQKQAARPRGHVPDSHWQRTFSSGTYKIEAKLDLHGLTQEKAFSALSHFIEAARHKKQKRLLVITGKGAGILREKLPVWLENQPLSRNIVTYHAAHAKHGGAGAWYVVVRG